MGAHPLRERSFMHTLSGEHFISRHYIIVVHGVGEQRHNETTVEVVNRFATARAKQKPASPYESLLPGSLSSLSMRRKGGGQGWSEFEGIPVEPGSVSAAFDGTCATTTSGKNFRFVDMRWADILQSHHGVYGSSTKQWTVSLLARLQPPFTPIEVLEPWVMPLLKEMKQTLLPIQGLLKWYAPAIEKSVFHDVIGDIHLYGDYTRTRGQAVTGSMPSWTKFTCAITFNGVVLNGRARMNCMCHLCIPSSLTVWDRC